MDVFYLSQIHFCVLLHLLISRDCYKSEDVSKLYRYLTVNDIR